MARVPLRQLTETDLIDKCPTWSPDGNQLAYKGIEYETSHYETSYAGIVTYNAIISLGTWIVSTDVVESFQIFSSDSLPGGLGCPKWSPDGERIAFVAGRNSEIFLVNADGTNLTQLTDFVTNTFAKNG